MTERISLLTRVNPRFAEGVKYFADREGRPVASYMRNSMIQNAVESAKQLTKELDEKTRAAELMRNALKDGTWKELADSDSFPDTEAGWQKVIEEYQERTEELKVEIEAMRENLSKMDFALL